MPADPNAPSADRSVYVRPKGHVEDHAVIRRIGDRELFLGNRHAADPAFHDREFEHVLSVSTEAYPLTTRHRPLTDGPGNDWAAFEAAVEDARDLHRRGDPSLVHCEAGISRSTTVLATALAAEEGGRFSEAVRIVQDARPHAQPHPALAELGVTYLAAMAREERSP